MKTQTVLHSQQAAPHSAVVLSPLLLTETSSVTRPTDTADRAAEELNVRAARTTGVLREILEEKGYSHSGLNE